MKWFSLILPPLAVLVVLTAAAEVYVRVREVPKYLVPAPSAVAHAVAETHEELLAAVWQTTEAALVGFAASALVGIGLAVALSSAKIVRNAFYPYTVFFQTVPVVAIAPLLLIWFGPGLQSVAVCAFIVSVFPVIANTLTGLLSTDPALADMFKLYRANFVATLFKLKLPGAMPSILTGLRVAAGLSVIGTIVGEFQAGDLEHPGVGVMIVESSKLGQTPQVFAAILVASMLGLAMLSVLNLAGYLLLRRWHASARD
ncbi:ABC transporter permease [soil metagenome]